MEPYQSGETFRYPAGPYVLASCQGCGRDWQEGDVYLVAHEARLHRDYIIHETCESALLAKTIMEQIKHWHLDMYERLDGHGGLDWESGRDDKLLAAQAACVPVKRRLVEIITNPVVVQTDVGWVEFWAEYSGYVLRGAIIDLWWLRVDDARTQDGDLDPWTQVPRGSGRLHWRLCAELVGHRVPVNAIRDRVYVPVAALTGGWNSFKLVS